ncbi:SDR family NAD(P)-dependent oxidoreductase [Occallatibacter savannae]|uniref:SDR family NAD(P)-dependent oxidoreductase n=1 Tax=Occallatibacter savannae TaxID=1002691 RepID=UPI000D698232|nr:SDR family NAD(P)-dependent oxidoreductase [Occallatibacter savannae]
MQDFAGKVAVITGAASGIGRAIAEQCVALGVKTVLADVEQAALDQAGSDLQARGGTVLCVRTDVSKRADVEALADKAYAAFGQVHLLFNNAGIGAGGVAWEATWNDWEWAIGVNLWGVINGIKVFLPRMIAQQTECHVVNTSSGAGLIAGAGSAPYVTTKHAVVALSENLHLGLEQRKSPIKVSVLCPGTTRTNIAFSERNRPEELRNPEQPMTPERQAGLAALKSILEKSTPSEKVAEDVFDAIRKEQFYVLTDPRWMEMVQMRVERLLKLENPLDPTPAVIKLLGSQA